MGSKLNWVWAKAALGASATAAARSSFFIVISPF
jgi:hypothetical protein